MGRDLRMETVEVDAPPPRARPLDAVAQQLLRDRRGRNQHRACRPVEPADIAPEPARRKTRATGEIVGKLGVIGGGEGEAQLKTPRSEEHTSELQSQMRTSYAI